MIERGPRLVIGAVVVRDIPPGTLAYGVPARVVRPINSDADWGRLL